MKWSIELFPDRTVIRRVGRRKRTLISWRHRLVQAALVLLVGSACVLAVSPCILAGMVVTHG